MTQPTLQDVSDIQDLLRENGYNATVLSSSADTITYTGGDTVITSVKFTIELN